VTFLQEMEDPGELQKSPKLPGSSAFLVRRNVAGSSTPHHGFVYSHVFVDTPDQSNYTRVDFPLLDGPCQLPLSVSPLLHENEGAYP
jgi:hypothetical protein